MRSPMEQVLRQRRDVATGQTLKAYASGARMVLSGILVGCGKGEKTFKAGETSYRCQGCRQERRPAPDFPKDGPILRCPHLAALRSTLTGHELS